MAMDIYSKVHRVLSDAEFGTVSEFTIPLEGSKEPVPILLVEQLVNWPGFGNHSRQLVTCAAGDLIEEGFLRAFHRSVDSYRNATGLIVYYGDLPQFADKLFGQFPNITIITYESLIISCINTSEYIEKWFPENSPSNLVRYYVGRRWETISTNDDRVKEAGFTHPNTLLEKIDKWLEDKYSQRQVVILGGAGTGKTWFCWHYCTHQMERYKKNPTKERLPIYIRLRDYTKFYDIVEFMRAKLDKLGIRIIGGYRGLRAFADRFLLVLDGFDEMETLKSPDILLRDIDEINRLITIDTKVLLTSRKVIFHVMANIQRLFSPQRWLDEGKDYLSYISFGNIGRKPRTPFEVLELLPFNKAEVEEALHKRGGDDLIEQLHQDQDLMGLSYNPLLLDRITPVLNECKGLEAYKKANIYEQLVQEWIRRPLREDRSAVRDIELKVHFAEEFAWHLMVRQINKLSYKDFPWRLWHLAEEVAKDSLEDPIKDDLRTQTFLEIDLEAGSEGMYKFTHPSLYDFFIARKLSLELKGGNTKNFGNYRLPEHVIHFLADLITNRAILMNALENARHYDANQYIHNWDPTKRYLARNAATALALMISSFHGFDLSYCDLRGAILKGVNLAGCKLIGTDLAEADLTNASLDGVLFDKETNFNEVKGVSEDLLAKMIPDIREKHSPRLPYPSDRMVLIPGGEFKMGSNNPGFKDEQPTHLVRVSPLYIDIHEITNREFLIFTQKHPEWGRDKARKRLQNEYYLELWNDDFLNNYSHHPVVYISWFGAIAYCNWRSHCEGLEPCYTDVTLYKRRAIDESIIHFNDWYESLEDNSVERIDIDIKCNYKADGYRLPTEAEWEFIARGGHEQWEYPWGNEFDQNEVLVSQGYTAPVLKAELNEFGVSGLVGNVREWCNDWYHPTYYTKSDEDWNDPKGSKREESLCQKVLRGGTMNRGPESHRCAFRSHVYPENTNVDAGFRCVRRIPESYLGNH